MLLEQLCKTSPTLVSLGCAPPTNADQPRVVCIQSKAIPWGRKRTKTELFGGTWDIFLPSKWRWSRKEGRHCPYMGGLPLASVGKIRIFSVSEMPYFVYLVFTLLYQYELSWALELLIRITLLSGFVLLSSYVVLSIRIMLECTALLHQTCENMSQRQSNCSNQRLWSSHFPTFVCILVIWRNRMEQSRHCCESCQLLCIYTKRSVLIWIPLALDI